MGVGSRAIRSRGLATFAAALLIASWGLDARTPADIAPHGDRQPAPDFILRNASGDPVKLSDYKGKVVLLDFWATWCKDCRTEIPWYIEFLNRYQTRGLEVVGVAMDGKWELVQSFVNQHHINYTVVMGSSEMTQLYSVKFLPKTLLIDREGKIGDTCVGIVNKGVFESEILALLRERPRNISR